MTYDTCINCTQEVTDPTNPSEETVFVHLDTFRSACDPEDLRAQGLKPEEGYAACPLGPSDDEEVSA